jgi:hypothetical protein
VDRTSCECPENYIQGLDDAQLGTTLRVLRSFLRVVHVERGSRIEGRGLKDQGVACAAADLPNGNIPLRNHTPAAHGPPWPQIQNLGIPPAKNPLFHQRPHVSHTSTPFHRSCPPSERCTTQRSYPPGWLLHQRRDAATQGRQQVHRDRDRIPETLILEPRFEAIPAYNGTSFGIIPLPLFPTNHSSRCCRCCRRQSLPSAVPLSTFAPHGLPGGV